MKLFSIKIFKLLLLSIFFYIFLTINLYLLSAIALTQGKILDYKVLIDYQVNFYSALGFRNIWQNQKECVEFDKDLIFVPKTGKCYFSNVEFETELNFEKNGRISGNNIFEKNKSIAVLGDSHGMGWGVNDSETFSSVLEREKGIKVYNLAVSGYATERSLLRLKKSNLLDKIDIIIIQYCGNDYGENLSHNLVKKTNNSKIKFDQIFEEKMSALTRFRKLIRYSLKIPFEVLTFKMNDDDWNNHQDLFEEIIEKYSFLVDKKIIVFGLNGSNINFYNFPNTVSKKISNLTYLDINFTKEDFFTLDGHLNSNGHKKIGKILADKINF